MPATVQHSSFPATLDGFNAQFDELRAWLDEKEVPARPHYQIELVFEEVATNIIRYGFDDPTGEIVDLECSHTGDQVVMTFCDRGRPFNPLEQAEPKKATRIEDADIGGLGIKLVRQTAEDVTYERTADHCNKLTVSIRL